MKLLKRAAAFLLAAVISATVSVTAFAESTTDADKPVGAGNPVGAELMLGGRLANMDLDGAADDPSMFPDISERPYTTPDLSKYLRWDGATPFEENTNYYIEGVTAIHRDSSFTLPSTSKLLLTEGSQLIVYIGGELKIRGTMTVAPNSTLTSSGSVVTLLGGRFENYGSSVFTMSSSVHISSQFINYEKAKLTFSGKLLVYKDGEFINYSVVTISPNSETTVTGVWNCLEKSTMYIKGSMIVTLSGRVDIDGYLSVTGKLTNSGMLVFEDKIKLYVDTEARLTLTKSGRIIDYREPDVPNTQEQFRAGIKGIDVSVWQGVIDWKKVKESGVKFALIRSSVGDRVDKMFEYNITEASKAGIKVGVYHYCYAMTVEEAREEAKHFLETIKPYKIDYPVMFDFEDNSQINLGRDKLTEIAEAFLSEVKNAGYYPMIYSYKNWLENLLDMEKLSEYEVAVAEWNVPSTSYTGNYGIWQYSCKGIISGIEGDVDLDICYKDYAKIIKDGGYNHLKEEIKLSGKLLQGISP